MKYVDSSIMTTANGVYEVLLLTHYCRGEEHVNFRMALVLTGSNGRKFAAEIEPFIMCPVLM